mgnify:FL=1
MNPGDMVLYRNTVRIPKSLLGIVLYEHVGVTKAPSDFRFFQVLLENGISKMIANTYLEVQNGERRW